MTSPSFPSNRMRRMRRDAFSRALMRESSVAASDLICPIYLLDNANQRQPIASMPGVTRVSIDLALEVAAECVELGIPAVALYPIIDNVMRNAEATEALNPDGLIPRAISSIKARFPELGVISEVSLAPYTASGAPGLTDAKGKLRDDDTVSMLVKQALNQACAGADILMMSDMVDRQVDAVRTALEQAELHHVRIMAVSASYSSGYFGPFGEPSSLQLALNKVDSNTWQLDPANLTEAIREAEQDLKEGADIIAVKPGLPYLDVIRQIKNRVEAPTFAIQANGEYSMVKAAAQNGWILHDWVMMESIMSFRRAGADAIITFFAREAARLLKQHG